MLRIFWVIPSLLLMSIGCGIDKDERIDSIQTIRHQEFDLGQIQTMAMMPNVEISERVDARLGDVSISEMRIALLDACALALEERGFKVTPHEAVHRAFFELEIDPNAEIPHETSAREGLPSPAVMRGLGQALDADAFIFLTVDDWGGGLDAGDRIDMRAELLDAQNGDLLWSVHKKTQGRTASPGLRDAALQEMFAPDSLR